MSDVFSRRDVIKHGTVIVGGLSLFGLTACTDKKAKPVEAPATATTAEPSAATGDGDPLISLDHSMAKPLKYIHDASAADPKLRVDKTGVAGVDQFCNNCSFYKPVEGKEYGACQLLPVPGKHVADKGWCQTWAKKA